MSTIINSIFWVILGIILFRCKLVPAHLSRLLGRSLYWIGVPLQIWVLANRSDFNKAIWIPPLATIIILLLGLIVALIIVEKWRQVKYLYLKKSIQFSWLNDLIYIFSSFPLKLKSFDQLIPSNLAGKGSFVLASMLGNTGFIGLSILPNFIDQSYWSWIVLYGVTHNFLGSYGLGAIVANYFNPSKTHSQKLIRLRDLLKVPSLWAFSLGYLTRSLSFPDSLDMVADYAILIVVPSAFLLIGIQLGKLRGIKSLKKAIVPTLIKILLLPGLVTIGLTVLGLEGYERLTLVLMSSMPTAFANVILAEEYNLDRQIAAGTILLSTLTFPLILPFWLMYLG